MHEEVALTDKTPPPQARRTDSYITRDLWQDVLKKIKKKPERFRVIDYRFTLRQDKVRSLELEHRKLVVASIQFKDHK